MQHMHTGETCVAQLPHELPEALVQHHGLTSVACSSLWTTQLPVYSTFYARP